MQHAPINDTARHRLEKVGMRNAPEVVREIGVHDFRMATEQQLLHLYSGLLSVSPSAVGVDFRRKIGFEDRLQHAAVMQTRSRYTRKRRRRPVIASTPCTTRSAATTFWRMPTPSAAPTRARPASTARILRTSKHTGSSDGWLNWRLRSGRRLTGRSQL